ncbi:hypothetical protein [Dendrosporobacter sp. 1207_IL3150]|uniref:hypothetical protein n=1 Tax=Dendrosporobacter sp. 1207_IL3150 TaxID=3084054 RepID=UPI002FDA3DAE
MQFSNYLKYFLTDIFQASGLLIIITLIFLGINSIETIEASLLWQIIILACIYTLYKFAFANKLDLGKKAHLISFTICSALATTLVIVWLSLLNPTIEKNLIIIYIVVNLFVKVSVYAMMYIDGQNQARQLNEKLSYYKNGDIEKS